MDITWFPHGHHVVSMHTTWLPCGYYVAFMCTPCGFQVDTMWFPGGQHRVSKVDTMWFPQDTTWFPHGCHVVSIWTPCVVEVTTWKPVQKTALHEANWLPCFTILPILHKTLVTVTKVFHGCTDQCFTLSGVTFHAKHANLNC